MKTSELTGAALDWAVAKCESLTVRIDGGMVRLIGQPFDRHYDFWAPSTDWEQGGPIIEREGVALYLYGNQEWNAHVGHKESIGQTPLIAAMRCFIAFKLGDEVEIPTELTGA
jgi:hypothetical protein